MTVVPREQRLGEIFVSLADTLVADFDIIDVWCNLSAACVEVLDFETAGLLISDKHGRLRTAASSDEDAEVLELLELQVEQGPGLACFTSGEPVARTEFALDTEWPRFTGRASMALPLAGSGRVEAVDLYVAGDGGHAGLVLAGGEVAGLLGGPWAGPVGALADQKMRVEDLQ